MIDVCGYIQPPALGVGRTALREHIARRIPRDEGARSLQGDANQPRCLAAELREKEVEADRVETVGLLDDLSASDIAVNDVVEFLEPVAYRPSFCQCQVVSAARLGFDDEIEHRIMSHLRRVLWCGLIERDHIRSDRDIWNRRLHPH